MNANGRPTADPKIQTIHVRLNQDAYDWLKMESENTGRSVTEIVREMILAKMP